ncbi:MAG4270 family putative restriction endonuclease [Mycoplasmopsis bovigenitalium]|uniref:MAG4270 family putative restriction endonuclease n=1 Tax=Mycoplasmopsis bovigenitalium TaxID=2112 RepID=UPI000BBA90DE|nr:hypothetical protein [Mycoplasmopsis bovigenitalium]
MRENNFLTNNLKVLKLHFASKNIENIKKPAYDLYLYILINPFNGLIYARKFDFKVFRMNLLTTPSWFVNKNSNFINRGKILEKCIGNNIQKLRTNNSSDSIINFSEYQIKKLNNLFNDYSQPIYQTTIYNINALINGSNPSGSVQNNKSSQTLFMDDTTNSKFSVIVKIIESLTVVDANIELSFSMSGKDNFHLFMDLTPNELDELDELKKYQNTDNLSILDFFENQLNMNVKENYYTNIFRVLKNDFINKTLIDSIKNNIKNLSQMRKIDVSILRHIKQHRDNIKNIEPTLKIKSVWSEKAHIYNVEWIKQDIQKSLYTQIKNQIVNISEIDNLVKKCKELEWITDQNNLISMDATHHRLYDQLTWIFDENFHVYLTLKQTNNDDYQNILDELKKLKSFKQQILSNANSKINIVNNSKKYIQKRIQKVKNQLSQKNKNSRFQFESTSENWQKLN